MKLANITFKGPCIPREPHVGVLSARGYDAQRGQGRGGEEQKQVFVA